ncbi:MAG: hypothetical protein OJF60_002162 [Burkholderiaceae bacterium]|jgi:RND family efflux transporter MFP subunit|nr:MAG: hypothetical protein OJF60_002162 [Burkholderiaceae bacterium]
MKQPLSMILAGTALLCAMFAPYASAAPDAPSVLVHAVPLVRKLMATELTAYGSVIADQGAIAVVSVPRAGRVTRLDVTPGERVARAAPLMQFTTDPAALAAYRQADTAVRVARDDLSRTQQLADQQLATQSQLAGARKTLADAEANLAALQAQGSGRTAETLTAPFAGVVQAVNVKTGDLFGARAGVVQLIRAGAFAIALGVAPEKATQLRTGMTVQLTPVFGGADLSGRVSAVQGMIDPATRLVNVVVQPGCGAQCAALLPGMQMKGVIAVTQQTLWTVPRSAVLTDDNGAYVFQIADGHAHRVDVKVLAQSVTETGINGNLDPQHEVVVLGNYELVDGMAVRGAR